MRNLNTWGAGNLIGAFSFRGTDLGAAEEFSADIQGFIDVVTLGAEDGRLTFRVIEGGAITDYLILRADVPDINILKPLDMNTNNITNAGTLNTHTIPGGTSTFALFSDNLSVFAATTSLQLSGVISDETGTGLLVFNNTPTILTPTIASFVNATHAHTAGSSGGILVSTTALSDTADIAYLNTANTFIAGNKNTFAHSATTAGLGVLPIAGNPSGQADGDIWLNITTQQIFARINGANVDLSASGGEVFTWTANHDAANFSLLNFNTLQQNGTEADAGTIRLINASVIAWRNAANTDNLTLTAGADDILTFAGATFEAQITGTVAAFRTKRPEIIGNGEIGRITFQGQDSAGADQNYASIRVNQENNAAASPDGSMRFVVVDNNTDTIYININAVDGKDIDLLKPVNFNSQNVTNMGTLNTHTIPGGTSTFALFSDNLSVFAATTSLQFIGVISDETGTGLLVFNDTPTIITPTVASFVNATHDHQAAAGGGTLLSTAALSDTADIAYLNQANTFGAFLTTFAGSTLRIPVSATPTMAVDGDFAIDTDLGANFSHGFIKYFDGEEVVVVGMPVAQFGSPADGEAVTYNSTTNEFELRTPAGAGDMVLADVQTVTGAKTFGTIGGAVGKFILAGSTSGSTIVNAAAVAGSTTVTLQGVTGTLALLGDKLDAFAATTSAELAGVISDETGTGGLVFGTSPTLITPALGTPASGTMTNVSGTSLITGFGILTQDTDYGGNNLDNGGVIFLTEQAEADADVAGKGQIWVDLQTPNKLFFTDDAGTDFDLTAGGGSQTPWTSDIDADGFDLQDLSNIEFRATTGRPANNVFYITRDGSSEFQFNVPTGDFFTFSINNATKFQVDSSGAFFGGNPIKNLSDIQQDGIEATAGFLRMGNNSVGIQFRNAANSANFKFTLNASDNFVIDSNLDISTKDIITDTTTGTKIGTATTQKIGFWNATPVVQQAHIADPTGGGTVDAEARTAINSILAQLATVGLQAAS